MHMLRTAVVLLAGSLTAFEPGTPTKPAHRPTPASSGAIAGAPMTFTISGTTQITSAGTYGYTACSPFSGTFPPVVLEFWQNGQSVDRFSITSPGLACQTHYTNITLSTADFPIFAVVKIDGF